MKLAPAYLVADRAANKGWLTASVALLAVLAVPFFLQSLAVDAASGLARVEWSPNAGGLVRWPVKLMLPLGFGLLALQGVSEAIKRVAALRGYVIIDAKYERPLQ